MGKSAKVACPLPPRRVLATQWLIARNQRRLFGMHGEVKAATPLRHDRHDPLGVRFRLAADDTIIGKTPKKTPPLHAGLHHCDKPFVQDMMQQDIGQQWRRDATLGRALVRVGQLARLQHPGVEPLANQPQYASIIDPLLEPLAQIASVSGVETSTDRKSTRLNSSHSQISYAVFCLKK